MIDFPREPNPGENLDASWGARVVRALRALFPMPGPGINVDTGPTGTTISAAASHVARANSDGDGTVLGKVGVPSANDQMVVIPYPGGLSGPQGRPATLHSPCVFRRAPLVAGDIVLCHPCAVAVTGEGEES